MKTVGVLKCQIENGAKELSNAVIKAGGRIINIDRNVVCCQGAISEEYEVWFEMDGDADEFVKEFKTRG